MKRWLGAALAALGVLVGLGGVHHSEGQQPPQTQCVSTAIAGGSADAITIPLQPCSPTTTLLLLQITSTNTTVTPTLQEIAIPLLPAQGIVNFDQTPLVAGQLHSGAIVQMMNDGSRWRLLNGAGGGGPGTLTSLTGVTPITVGPINPCLEAGCTVGITIPSSSLLGGSAGNFTPVSVGSQLLLAGGALSAPLATSSTFGTSKPDNTTISVSSGTLTAQTATSSSLGIVEPDNTSIVISGGVLSSLGCIPGSATGVLFSGGATCAEDVSHFFRSTSTGSGGTGVIHFIAQDYNLGISGLVADFVGGDANQGGAISVAETAVGGDPQLRLGVNNNSLGNVRSYLFFNHGSSSDAMSFQIGNNFANPEGDIVSVGGLRWPHLFGDFPATFQIFTHDDGNVTLPAWALQAFTSAGQGLGGILEGLNSSAQIEGELRLYGPAAANGVKIASDNDSYINNGGNFGLGLSTPLAKLDVNGGVRIREVGIPGCGLANNALQADVMGNIICGTISGGGGGIGTVTSVGLGVPASSLFGASSTPVTSSGTLLLTTSGTSGGVPYFDTISTLNSSALLTQHALVVGGGAGGAPKTLGAASNGAIAIGSSGSDPVVTPITAGSGITVTNGPGSIILSASSGGSGIDQLTGDVLAGPGTGSQAATIKSSVGLSGAPTAATAAVGTNSTQIATTAFVQNALAGINPAVAVQAATTSASDTSGFTYNNGAAGIGAFFTGSINTPVVIDGFTFTTLGQRLLVKNDTQSPSGAFNGVYYVTQVQTTLLAPILTRALDYDQPSDINNTGAIPVVNGTVNGTTSWVITSAVTTVGTDPLTYVQFTQNPANVDITGGTINGTVIGGTSRAAISGTTGNFNNTLTTNIASGTQCVHANSSGVLSGTGSDCGSSSATGANPTATAGSSAVNGSAVTFMRSDAAPAVATATTSTLGIAKLNNPPCSIGWIAGVNPNAATMCIVNQASTISAIIGDVETATGGTATVTVMKAPSGTACSGGTALHSGTFNANGTAATNQILTVTTSNLSAGDRLCITTTGTTTWTGGTGVGGITVFLAPS